MKNKKWVKEKLSSEMVRWRLRDSEENVLVSMVAHVENLDKDPIVLYDFRVNDPKLSERVGMHPGGYTANLDTPYGYYMDTEQVKQFFDFLNVKNRPNYRQVVKELTQIPKLEKVKQRYGNNRWWESHDLTEIALFQFYEDTLMVDFNTYLEGLETILSRSVYWEELAMNRDRLEWEIQDAIKRFDLTGIYQLSNKESQKREVEAIKKIADYAEEKGTQVMFPQIKPSDEELN